MLSSEHAPVGCQSETRSLDRQGLVSDITEMQDFAAGCAGPGEPDSVLLSMCFSGNMNPASVKPLIADAQVLARVDFGSVDPKVQRIPRDTLATVDPTNCESNPKGAYSRNWRLCFFRSGDDPDSLATSRNAVHWFFMQEIAPDSGMAARILSRLQGGLSQDWLRTSPMKSVVEAAGLNGNSLQLWLSVDVYDVRIRFRASPSFTRWDMRSDCPKSGNNCTDEPGTGNCLPR